MTRLQRECLAASLVAHTGLLFLLALSSGFTAPKPVETEVVQLLNFVPDILVDAPVMGGGTPPANPPSAPNQPIVQPAVQPPPQPPKPRRAEEPRHSEKASEPPKTSPTGEKPAPPPRRSIEVNLKPVVRSPDQTRAERDRAEAEARRLAQVRQSQLARAVGNLSRTLSSSTSVSVPGTGGATYASYTSYVDMIYRQAWAPLKPRETGDRSLSVIARVVIARQGDVLVREIKRRSGNEALDLSVQAALDRVRTIGRPFPEGAPDDQREFLIEFNLESLPGAG